MVRHDDVELILLENLVPNEYSSFMEKIIPVSTYRIRELNQFLQTGDLRNIPVKSIRENTCMRIKLRNSPMLFIPESTQLLTRKIIYFEDKMSFAGFMATYVPDLNHFTLLRVLDSEKLKQYFFNNSINISKDIYQRFSPKTERLPEYSSLNFLLQHRATNVTRLSSYEINHLNHCFEFAYWHMPTHNIFEEYDLFHNFIYHSYHKIHEICDIFKTLIKIEKIDSPQHKLVFLKKLIKYRHVTVKILYGGTKCNYLETVLFVLEPLASQIRQGDIINGIIANCHKFSFNDHKLILVNAIGNIIHTPSKSDLKTLTAIVAHLHNRHEQPTKFIESFTDDRLLSDINTLLTFNMDFFGTAWNSLLDKDSADVSITGLYPVLLRHDQTIYIIPPALISYLSPHKKFLRPDLLYEIVNLINSVPLCSDRTSQVLDRINQGRIRRSNSYAALQAADTSHELCKTLFSDLPHLLNYISYSRIISKSIL